LAHVPILPHRGLSKVLLITTIFDKN
jgi:hypothetical protein